MTRKILALGLMTAFLAACGQTEENRALSGAGLGAAGGALVGAPLLGAGAGAATGAVTEEEDIDLGEPIWE